MITNPETKITSHARRLLRCRKTRHYFTGHGWTHDVTEAKSLHNNIDAARTCIDHNLHDIELVLFVPLTWTEMFATKVR